MRTRLLMTVLVGGGALLTAGLWAAVDVGDDDCAAIEATAAAHKDEARTRADSLRREFGVMPYAASTGAATPRPRAQLLAAQAAAVRLHRAGLRLITDNPECFDASTVAVAEDVLRAVQDTWTPSRP